MAKDKIKTPYEYFGIECESGWKPLYQPIIDYVTEYNKDKKEKEKIEIAQIKEKFGLLTIYTYNPTNELRKMIQDAEDKSYHMCEICGKEIEKPINEHHWIYPMCEKCFNDRKEKLRKEVEAFANNMKKKKEKREDNKSQS